MPFFRSYNPHPPSNQTTKPTAMGCVSSKRVDAVSAADVYRPPPSSISLFDVSKIEEPWLITTKPSNTNNDNDHDDEKPSLTTKIMLPILDKLDDSLDLAPKPWSEVSKALEDLKPTLHQPPLPPPKKSPPSLGSKQAFETITNDLILKEGYRPVKDNSFLVRDREEKESKKGGDTGRGWKPRDPFEGCVEVRPPGNDTGIVMYTTTLRGVRRTFEDCETVRRVVECTAVDVGVEVDERDVSLHGEYLRELKEMLGEEGAAVPRVFVGGRYVGGAEEVVELGETGRLRDMMRWVVRRGGGGDGKGRKECGGCGGARFVPCLECNGSRKVVAEGGGGAVVQCGECNENGLVLCPMCH